MPSNGSLDAQKGSVKSMAKPDASSDGFDVEVLLGVLAQVSQGDFSARMPLAWTGVAGKAADGINAIILANQSLESELSRICRVVGKQGELSQRVQIAGSPHGWATSVEAVNSLIDALVRPTTEMQRVIGAVADGDLSKKVQSQVDGEMLQLKNTINGMVDQLNGFISEVTRVVREVGTEGKLGQAAAVTVEVGGVWKELTDNVNLMAGNLTAQVRNIAEVTTAVANGDLSKKIAVDVKGEFLELKNTVNAKVDKLRAFSGEVTRVAHEVGVEGKLGGQARSEEHGGVWKELTDNVNQLAANLTNQVREITEVATAVTEGDLSRQVSVEASGEVATLKDKLNEMIRNLRETTRKNVEQDWLNTNRERFSRMLQGQRDLATASSMILSELAPLVSAQHAVFYVVTSPSDGSEPVLQLEAGYGYEERRNLNTSFRFGQGLVGQCAKEKKRILLTDVPSDYVRINSGLGQSPPLNIIVLPVLFEGSVRAVVELASFTPFSPTHQALLDQLPESIGVVLNTIEANTVTENLLEQSQTQAHELRSQQEELRESNEDLEGQTQLLAEQNREVEQSRRLLEEKAEQLAVSSKYKSEFIANMSHELRTPLNSLLILAEQLEDNAGDTMTQTQVEYAGVIRSSGNDLLQLLNSILDLAKAESGTISITRDEVSLSELAAGLLREYGPMADTKGLGFAVDVAPDCPRHIVTDSQRLGQVLRNLLSNAFKFTENGSVKLEMSLASTGWRSDRIELAPGSQVIALSVSDTGIGVGEENRARIFEAFAQGDGSTARQYGGTGLGLSIARELAGLLNGELTLESSDANGSTFTLYVPTDLPSLPARAVEKRGGGNRQVERRRPDQTRGGKTVQIERRRPVESLMAPDLEPVVRAEVRDPVPPVDRRNSYRVEDTAFAGARVLVVDDDFRNVFAMKALLERGGAIVSFAESGAAAISLLEGKPEMDIVLMDIMMPVMDGYATIRGIRKLDHCKDLPIIAVTGKVMAGERQRCLDAGANDYVPKPVDTGELVAAISPWLPVLVAAVQPWVAPAVVSAE